jgi:hypothetical protein
MEFIQLIEFTTARPGEVETLLDKWLTQTAGRRAAQRGTFTQDGERPNTYLQMVEFPSHENAMANSDLPETWPQPKHAVTAHVHQDAEEEQTWKNAHPFDLGERSRPRRKRQRPGQGARRSH